MRTLIALLLSLSTTFAWEVVDMNGNHHTESDLHGKIIWFHFNFESCAPGDSELSYNGLRIASNNLSSVVLFAVYYNDPAALTDDPRRAAVEYITYTRVRIPTNVFFVIAEWEDDLMNRFYHTDRNYSPVDCICNMSGKEVFWSYWYQSYGVLNNCVQSLKPKLSIVKNNNRVVVKWNKNLGNFDLQYKYLNNTVPRWLYTNTPIQVGSNFEFNTEIENDCIFRLTLQ